MQKIVPIDDILNETEPEHNLLIDRRLFSLVNRLLNEQGFMLHIESVSPDNMSLRTKMVKIL